ncbi:type VI secretion protein VasK [Pseudomonas sp. PDM26]|uniref:ImcF-related family protein n=1 Tax=Pseudomonas sp. PDM26 TaxID=2854766 RepID=UPI001C48BF38|nr:ImcF-related family protein [Pseudomonas sp. PDM26]MBV7550635.1 type VI secretion protein VasK [Pseudomonas sp. PDM26]
MQFLRSVGIGTVVSALMLVTVALGALVWRSPESLGMTAGSTQKTLWLSVISVAAFIATMFLGVNQLLRRQMGSSTYHKVETDDSPEPARAPRSDTDQTKQLAARLGDFLRQQHGPFWRHKTRLLLIVGEPEQISAITPGLRQDHWLEDQNTILIWGGSVNAELDAKVLAQCRRLTRWRALDGVVWALSPAQSADEELMGNGARHLQDLARQLGWSLPLHLWQVCASPWQQDKRPVQAVGCPLPARLTESTLETSLHSLLEPLRDEGWAQMQTRRDHDFLLRLTRDLQVEGIARWRQALAPLFGMFSNSVALRGLWFSLPLTGKTERKEHDHFWPMGPAWHGVLEAPKYPSRRVGWSGPRVVYGLTLGLALLWGAGLLLSFASNRVLIAHVQTSLTTLQQSAEGDAQLRALHELTRELSRLDYRATHGSPWYQRFGLNQNDALLTALWPRYVEANQRLLRDPAAANLKAQLKALIKLPPDSPERAKRAHTAYVQLKAYLMLARPDKTDPAFLAKALTDAVPQRAGFSPGLWQGLAPTLWAFYAEQLEVHPDWRIDADPKLVAQARQVLLGQLGQRNGEASLYQAVLDTAANHAPALGLQQMVGDTDALALFATSAEVPGVFTRQAWEGQVRQAIDAIAEARREEIDWVLSDNPARLAADLSPEQLKERLTERYFQDYANAWLDFLNRLRWQPVDSLGEVIDQLALMSDVRQSPLIALMNNLAYQGQAGSRGPALTDSLVKSAQQLLGPDKTPMIDQSMPASSGPLDATFGPLLTLLGKDVDNKNDSERLSLQAFLNRVTRVRLKLQQVSNAANPQAMTQALAQTVFQGNNVDLSDTQSYGSLLAASLGAEWDGIGQTLFVQPLDQAWQRVLQPSAAGLNSLWQRAIVRDWRDAFAGRYPLAATASDASLPMLGQMIRADSGRIEQFLHQQLGGVLRKEGSRWVADTRHSQGLRFNPQFLAAINQLSHLADVLYTDGGMGLSFELRGKPVRDVVQTTFILNGEKHEYFNQKESWQRFSWPGFTQHPGTRLTWISVQANERLFGDYEGTWGLIRLLEQARITALNDSDSHYRVQVRAPDGLDLTWHLRTELGAGPLALLKLRGFELPARIFLGEGTKTLPLAQTGSYE